MKQFYKRLLQSHVPQQTPPMNRDPPLLETAEGEELDAIGKALAVRRDASSSELEPDEFYRGRICHKLEIELRAIQDVKAKAPAPWLRTEWIEQMGRWLGLEIVRGESYGRYVERLLARCLVFNPDA